MCCSGCLRGHVDVHTDNKSKSETKSRLGELGSGAIAERGVVIRQV